MNKEHFYHYRPQGGRPTTILGIWEGDNLKLSASTCSPSDQFVKKVGRENARKRMLIGGPQMVFHFNDKIPFGRSRFFVECAAGMGEIFSQAPSTLIPIK